MDLTRLKRYDVGFSATNGGHFWQSNLQPHFMGGWLKNCQCITTPVMWAPIQAWSSSCQSALQNKEPLG